MSFPITELGAKIIAAVAAACVLGGGTVVLGAQRDNAVQDSEIAGLKDQQLNIVAAVQAQTRELQETNKKLERLMGQIEGRRDGK